MEITLSRAETLKQQPREAVPAGCVRDVPFRARLVHTVHHDVPQWDCYDMSEAPHAWGARDGGVAKPQRVHSALRGLAAMTHVVQNWWGWRCLCTFWCAQHVAPTQEFRRDRQAEQLAGPPTKTVVSAVVFGVRQLTMEGLLTTDQKAEEDTAAYCLLGGLN